MTNKPAPLKDKETSEFFCWSGDSMEQSHTIFAKEDVASAVEWLKGVLYAHVSKNRRKVIHGLIDEAFADVVEVSE